ncbi:MAG: hypothetical protein HUJ52_01780, partial [Malacoplasma sp.]|nr:hypothetical protein [Malacoplasma sp.]
SVVIPYEDFGDNLEVIDGAASDLVLDFAAPEYFDDCDIGEYTLAASYEGIDLRINKCDVYLNKQGIVGAYYEDGKIKMNGLKAGEVELTIRAVSGKHVGIIHKSYDVGKVYNKITYGDGTYVKLADELDVAELCGRPMTVTEKHGTTVTINNGNIRNIRIDKIKDGTTAIPNNFMNGCYCGDDEPVEEINLSAFKDVTSIGEDFLLESYTNVVDISALTKLESIGSITGFPSSYVEKFIFPKESNITSIGNYFFGYYSVGELVNLGSCMKNVTSIGLGFLYMSGGSGKLDLSEMTSLETVGEQFLYGTGYTEVDLSGMTNLKTIGPYFMSWATWLTYIKLPIVDPANIATNGGWGGNIGDSLDDPIPVTIDCGTVELKEAYNNANGWKNTGGMKYGCVWKPE